MSYLNYRKFTAMDATHEYIVSYRTHADPINAGLIAQMTDVLMLHESVVPPAPPDYAMYTSTILKVFRGVGDSYVSPAGDFIVTFDGGDVDGVAFSVSVPHRRKRKHKHNRVRNETVVSHG